MVPMLGRMGPVPIGTHDILVAVGVLVAAVVFVHEVRRRGVTDDRIWVVLAGALVGGALLARLGTWLQHVDLRRNASLAEQWLYGNRSILSGPVGAYLGALVAKRLSGYRTSTGDLFAPAVAIGMAIGRIGCLLTELPGKPTNLPWGITLTPAQAAHIPGAPAGVPLHRAVAHRLHFFTERIPPSLFSEDEIARFDNLGYLGYTVLRPLPGAPAGRTMLAPAANSRPHVTCVATDKVNLLGEPLEVEAAPFVSQDAQMSVCAHATLWMIAYYHHLAFGGPRLLPGDISAAVPDDIGRGTRSMGLTLYQISVAASRLGYPALVYGLDPPPPDETVQRLACRYLNSGIPVIVGGAEHVFLLVGYERLNPGQPDERIRFIRHDDETGIYLNVDNFLLDEYAPWEYMVIPLPQKVYMPGEDAEKIGEAFLRQAIDDATDSAAGTVGDRLADRPARSASAPR